MDRRERSAPHPNGPHRNSQALGAQVTAEGIETAIQLDELLGISCRYGQGYLFSRPLPEHALRSLLERGSMLRPRGIRAKATATGTDTASA